MQRYLISFGFLLCALAILLTTWFIFQAMSCYPGGTILDRGASGYNIWSNYLSDLGRRNAWNSNANMCSNQFFDTALYLASGSIILFFSLFPFILLKNNIRFLALFGTLLGIGSALAYLGIAWFPLDVNYRLHTIFVRVGFISFWLLSLLFASLIRHSPNYPRFFAWVMYFFATAFAIQIAIMLFGPRAWSSHFALQLQVTAQKLIVGLQLLVMLVQILGAYIYTSKTAISQAD